jgi:pimeloyl-ACP methyl ester carboxylesterase/quercetin dioxygenase-like cupin family protein
MSPAILLVFTLAAATPPDPTVTDGDKYRVILENDRVRVIDYRDQPGAVTKQHHHPAFVLYVLSPFKRKLTFPDGTVKVRDFKTGEVFWMEEQTHVGQNVGTTETHALLVEPKGSARSAAHPVFFPTEDGGIIYADEYGKGERAVVLAHGGRFDKESWQTQAVALAAVGFRVVAIDFRGRGRSMGPGSKEMMSAPLHLDVLAAVRYLRGTGAKSVSVVGGSMGGGAAADAQVRARPGEIDRLVLLGASGNGTPEKLAGRKLFIVARDDASGEGPRLPGIRAYYDKVPEPKRLVVVDGSAHAQFLFSSNQAEQVMTELVRFLSAP